MTEISVSPETLRSAVMSMDLSFLTPDTLAKLVTLQPQPQELAILRAVKPEDVAGLPKVGSVPHMWGCED